MPAAADTLRLAYADPPYPGRAHLYKGHSDYAGEVDHASLALRLEGYDGWALSTNSDSLAYVLRLFRTDVLVAVWVRTNAPPFNPDGRGSVRSWEPVIYRPARTERLAPLRVRDVFKGGAPTGSIGGELTGAKRPEFCAWVFALLGADCDDSLDDLFPGTGIVGREWSRWAAQPTLIAGAIGGPRSNEHLHEQTDAFDIGDAA